MPVEIGGMLALMRKEALARPKHPETIELQLDIDALLLGSEIELHSIFQNLISNALKFTPVTGRLEIRWWADAAGGHVSVADSGIGIPAEHLPRLTERFYRVDPGRSRGMGGSGLGLAIVKHALNRHDGRLEIDQRGGQGQYVYLSLSDLAGTRARHLNCHPTVIQARPGAPTPAIDL